MKLTAPENFDGDAATDQLDPTWKAQVDLSQLDRPDTQAALVSGESALEACACSRRCAIQTDDLYLHL